MTVIRYTAALVRQAVEGNVAILLAPWMVGRPENYTIDPTTRDLIALGYWVDKELALMCNDDDRRTQIWKYNRLSRTYDIWETAAEVLNDVIDGKVEQNRRGHRRWG